MRPTIHIYGAIDLSDLAPVMDGQQPLRVRIPLLPDAVVSRRYPGVRRDITHTLLLFHRLPRCRPGQGIETSSVIQRKPAPIPDIASRRKESGVLVIKPSPRPGEIRAADQWPKGWADSRARGRNLPQKDCRAYK